MVGAHTVPTDLPWIQPLLHLPSRTLTANHAYPEASTWFSCRDSEMGPPLAQEEPLISQPYTLTSEPREHRAVHPLLHLGTEPYRT